MSDRVDQPGQTVQAAQWPSAVVRTLDADLERLQQLWLSLDVTLTGGPALNSVAAVEHGDPLSAFAHDLAATFLRSAVDHLVTWLEIVRAGFRPTYAHMSLIRTAHESAWLAYWLMEPDVDAETRLARGVAAQCDDYKERRNMEEAMNAPKPQPPARSAADRLKDLMAEAEARGLTRLNRPGRQILVTPRLSAVELFDKYEPVGSGVRGSYLYRLYSGYAHGKRWALTLGVEAVGPRDASGRTLALARSNRLQAVASTQRAVNALERALGAFASGRLGRGAACSLPAHCWRQLGRVQVVGE